MENHTAKFEMQSEDYESDTFRAYKGDSKGKSDTKQTKNLLKLFWLCRLKFHYIEIFGKSSMNFDADVDKMINPNLM